MQKKEGRKEGEGEREGRREGGREEGEKVMINLATSLNESSELFI